MMMPEMVGRMEDDVGNGLVGWKMITEMVKMIWKMVGDPDNQWVTKLLHLVCGRFYYAGNGRWCGTWLMD